MPTAGSKFDASQTPANGRLRARNFEPPPLVLNMGSCFLRPGGVLREDLALRMGGADLDQRFRRPRLHGGKGVLSLDRTKINFARRPREYRRHGCTGSGEAGTGEKAREKAMRSSRRRSMQRGFTLIELIITIVIIGVLAAVAIPKFQDLSSDAEQGVAAGVAAAISSATSVNYGRSKAPGAVQCDGTAKKLALGNCTYYPISNCSTLGTAAPDLADFPSEYSIGGTATLTADGNSKGGCTVNKGGVAVAFKAYGA